MTTASRKAALFRGTLLGVCLLIPSSPSWAEAMILPFVKGPGAEECIQYITVFHQPSDKYQLYTSWLQGYASRIGLEEAIKQGRIVDYLNGTSVDDMAAWLNNWCERNPFKSFYLAGAAFIKHASGVAPVPQRGAAPPKANNPPPGTPDAH